MRKIFYRAQGFSFKKIFSRSWRFFKEILQFPPSKGNVFGSWCWLKFLCKTALDRET